MMWAAGILASLGSITYPAISAFVSIHSDVDTQGKCFNVRMKLKQFKMFWIYLFLFQA